VRLEPVLSDLQPVYGVGKGWEGSGFRPACFLTKSRIAGIVAGLLTSAPPSCPPRSARTAASWTGGTSWTASSCSASSLFARAPRLRQLGAIFPAWTQNQTRARQFDRDL